MYVRREQLTLLTDGTGAVTGFLPAATGRVHGIIYVADGSAAYDNTVDVTVTAEKTGETILAKANIAASTSFYPRALCHASEDGAAATLDGTRAMRDMVAVDNDRIKFVLAQGGAAKTGTWYVVFV